MYKKIISILILIGVVSCAAPKAVEKEPIYLDEYTNSDYFKQNFTVTYQTRLAVPEGWKLLTNKNKEIVYTMQDDKGIVFGNYRYVKFNEVLSPSAVGHWVANEFLSDYKDKIIRKTFVDKKVAYLIIGTHSKKNYDLMTLTLTEGKNLNVFQLVSEPGYLKKYPEIGYKIFASYKMTEEDYEERRIKKFISFKCEDGKFFFDGDDEDRKGYWVWGKILDAGTSINIEESPYKSFEEASKNYKFKLDEPFDASFTLSDGTAISAKANYFKNSKITIIVYYFTSRGINYEMNFIFKNQDLILDDYSTYHEKEEVQQVVKKYFYYYRG